MKKKNSQLLKDIKEVSPSRTVLLLLVFLLPLMALFIRNMPFSEPVFYELNLKVQSTVPMLGVMWLMVVILLILSGLPPKVEIKIVAIKGFKAFIVLCLTGVAAMLSAVTFASPFIALSIIILGSGIVYGYLNRS